jgi:hypothetical protein
MILMRHLQRKAKVEALCGNHITLTNKNPLSDSDNYPTLKKKIKSSALISASQTPMFNDPSGKNSK